MGGYIALIGVLTGFAGEVAIPALFPNQIRISGISIGSRADQEDMIRAITANRLKPVIDRRFLLQEIVAAFKYYESQKHLISPVDCWMRQAVGDSGFESLTAHQIRTVAPLGCAVLEEVMVGRRVQAANRCARSLADLTRRVDQLAVVLEAARVAVRTCRGDREVECEAPDDQSEPSRAGLRSNSGTGIGSPKLSVASAALD